MSIEEGYENFLGSYDSLSWEEYTVYSYLVRAGYYVFLPDYENDSQKFEMCQIKHQSRIEDQMIWCVLNELSNLPYSFDFINSNQNLYHKTKAALRNHSNAIRGEDSQNDESCSPPPSKKIKIQNNQQERNFLDILKADLEYLTYEELFTKFSKISRHEYEASQDEEDLEFSFDIYYQKSNFKRTEQLASYRMLVLSPKSKFPSYTQLENLKKNQPYEVPIIIAIVSQSIQFSICIF